MAIAAAWVVNSTAVSSSTAIYTVPAATSATYAYARDLIITNAGTVSCFVALGTGVTGSATTSSFVVPTGGSVILTQCQVPASSIVNVAPQSGTCTVSVGWGTNVSYV